MKLIPLTQGYQAMVDDEDYDRIIQYKWQVRKYTANFYAQRGIYRKWQSMGIEFLHNFIMPPLEGFTIDHIDRNGLNCQKYNLRLATRSQQIINKLRDNKTGYRGVFPNGNGWQAVVKYQNKRYGGGTYKTAIDAAKAYDKLAKQIQGEFAILNFPEK